MRGSNPWKATISKSLDSSVVKMRTNATPNTNSQHTEPPPTYTIHGPQSERMRTPQANDDKLGSVSIAKTARYTNQLCTGFARVEPHCGSNAAFTEYKATAAGRYDNQHQSSATYQDHQRNGKHSHHDAQQDDHQRHHQTTTTRHNAAPKRNTATTTRQTTTPPPPPPTRGSSSKTCARPTQSSANTRLPIQETTPTR